MAGHEVERALQALCRGEFVLVYDSDKRERETDLVLASQFVEHHSIRRMRKDGGGLICTTVPAAAWNIFVVGQMDSIPIAISLPTFSACARTWPT